MVCRITKKRKKIWIIIVLFCVAYLIRGEKFTPFYQMGLYFAAAYFFTKPFRFKEILFSFKIKRIVKIFIAVLISLQFVYQISNKYQKEFSLNPIDALKYIEYRALGLQGHLWWGTDNLSPQLSTTERERSLKLEIRNIFNFNAEDEIYGIRQLMLFVSPVLGAQAIEKGINFTMGYPAIIVYFFGYFKGMFILFLQGIFISIFYLLIAKKLMNKNYLSLLFLLIIYSQINYYYIMGSFHITITLILAIILVLFISILTKLTKKGVRY